MTSSEHEAQRKLVIASLLSAARRNREIRSDYARQAREYRKMWR